MILFEHETVTYNLEQMVFFKINYHDIPGHEKIKYIYVSFVSTYLEIYEKDQIDKFILTIDGLLKREYKDLIGGKI